MREAPDRLNQRVIDDTRRWLERAVIGLNLCPFAKAVHAKGQVHYAVSRAETPNEVLADLDVALAELAAHDPEQRDTTLLVVPCCLHDFLAFNDLLGRADKRLRRTGREGQFQLASFHPQYCFAGTEAHDISNFTNRAPYPTLHLLREASIDRAVRAFPQAEAIYQANIDTMRRLGMAGWHALDVGPSAS